MRSVDCGWWPRLVPNIRAMGAAMVQQLPRRKRLRPVSLPLQTLALCACASLLVISVADAQTPCPSITNVRPPSGSRRTEYTIFGENLDQPSTISVIQDENDILGTLNITASAIVFTLNEAEVRTDPATVLLVPEQGGCSDVSVELYILRQGMGIVLTKGLLPLFT